MFPNNDVKAIFYLVAVIVIETYLVEVILRSKFELKMFSVQLHVSCSLSPLNWTRIIGLSQKELNLFSKSFFLYLHFVKELKPFLIYRLWNMKIFCLLYFFLFQTVHRLIILVESHTSVTGWHQPLLNHLQWVSLQNLTKKFQHHAFAVKISRCDVLQPEKLLEIIYLLACIYSYRQVKSVSTSNSSLLCNLKV